MRKLAFLILGITLIVTGLNAQVGNPSLNEGIKLLNYEKNKSALDFFKAASDKNPSDAETMFWYGQALLAQNYNGVPTPEYIQKAKALYQQGLQTKGSDSWLLVGMAHIQYLEGGDAGQIKNNLELAITASKFEKGKNRGKNNPDIINAIARIFAELPMNIGDHNYAIDKAKEVISAFEGQPINPNLFMNLGINYLKLGGERGGEAVSAFSKAIDADANNAYAYYRIGKVYQSQSNKDVFEENYSKAISIDPAIAPVYVSLYNFYASIDTTIARKNLDLFIKNADKDPAFEYLYADYLFQIGKYNESLEKGLNLKNTIGIETYPRIAVLLAYNYDRKGDSVSAKTYIEQFVNNTAADKVLPTDYDLAVKVLAKFPGAQTAVAAILEKAIAASASNKKATLKFYKLGYEMFEKSNLYNEAYQWFARYAALNGVKDEFFYFKTGSFALNAKNGLAADSAANGYIAAFPDKSRGYVFKIKAAMLLDSTNQKGLLIEALNMNAQFLLKDVATNKQKLIDNYGQMLVYYNELKDYDNAVVMCDKILELAPGDANMIKYREQFAKNAALMKNNQNKGGAKPAATPPVKNN